MNIDGTFFVSPRKITLKNEFLLKSGKSLTNLEICYETYGKLNSDSSNVVLVIHALTSNHHVAGYYKNDNKNVGWWDDHIGSGKTIDTDRFFVICANCLGGCSGTTGPNSINPKTKKSYNMSFPIITIEDMANVQIELLNYLKIKKVYAVIGPSMGGMQALYLTTHYPDTFEKAVIVASTHSQSAQHIAFSAVARQAIIRDPLWNNGNYREKNKIPLGLSVARMLSHITYLSEKRLNQKFGRELQDKEDFDFTFSPEFKIESYLNHQGNRFIEYFDANSYLYISKALNYFHLQKNKSTLAESFKKTNTEYLLISFSSDWAYPPKMSKELFTAMSEAGKKVKYIKINTNRGHDAFLIEKNKLNKIIYPFLSNN